jgi:hypothetical protein
LSLRFFTLIRFFISTIIISPLLAIIHLPVFWYRQVFKELVLVNDTTLDPVLNYSADINTSGLFYWLRNAAGIKRSGILGYDFRTYCGTPTGLFDFPLTGYLLTRMSYKNLFLLSLVMIVSSMAFLFDTGSVHLVYGVVIFLLLSSNIIWEQLSCGLYEILPWAFAFATIGALHHHWIIVGGILLGLIALLHPTVFMIAFLVSNFYLLASTGSLLDNIYFNVPIIPVAAWWIFSFFSNRHNMCRGEFLSYENKGEKGAYSRDSLVQLGLYLMFCGSFIFGELNILLIVLLLPVVASVLNYFVWVFSPYTLRMMKFFCGAIILAASFNYISLVCFLPLLFIKPLLIAGFFKQERYNIGIRSFRDDKLTRQVQDVFSEVKEFDMVCLEYIGKTWRGIYFVAFLSFVLRNSRFRIFNVGFSEIYNKHLFAITKSFNASDYSEAVMQQLNAFGKSYMVAFSDNFRQRLISLGYTEANSISLFNSPIKLNYRENGYVPDNIYLMEPPPGAPENYEITHIGRNSFEATLINPGVNIIPVQYFPGLTIYYEGKSIAYSVTTNNFLEIDVDKAGPVTVRYSRRKMFIASLQALVNRKSGFVGIASSPAEAGQAV